MTKDIVKYTLAFGVFFFLGYFLHSTILEDKKITLPYSLENVYLFHTLFSLIVCVAFSILSKNQKFFEQLGFVYLGVLIFKITFFCAVFYSSIFSVDLTKKQSLSLLIPIALFLFLEVYFITQILNRKDSKTIK